MSRAYELNFTGVVEHHHDALAAISSAGDFACVSRGAPRAIVMKCPDGCGDTVTVNIDPRSGKAWRADLRDEKLSLYPSVWRDDGCGAHFIVWSNHVFWCDRSFRRPEIRPSVVSDIRKALRPTEFRSYADIAIETGIHPWEALWACQTLVERGLAKVREQSSFAGPTEPVTKPTPPEASRKRPWWKFW